MQQLPRIVAEMKGNCLRIKNLAYRKHVVHFLKLKAREVHIAVVWVIPNQEKRKGALYLECNVFSLFKFDPIFSIVCV